MQIKILLFTCSTGLIGYNWKPTELSFDFWFQSNYNQAKLARKSVNQNLLTLLIYLDGKKIREKKRCFSLRKEEKICGIFIHVHHFCRHQT